MKSFNQTKSIAMKPSLGIKMMRQISVTTVTDRMVSGRGGERRKKDKNESIKRTDRTKSMIVIDIRVKR